MPDESDLDDSVVSEVRAIREALDAEAKHDLTRLVERTREVAESVRKERGMKLADVNALGPKRRRLPTR